VISCPDNATRFRRDQIERRSLSEAVCLKCPRKHPAEILALRPELRLPPSQLEGE